MRIEARKWVAVWYRCPKCGRQTGETLITPWRWKHRQSPECFNHAGARVELEIVERRWYTTFVIEPGLSFTTIAGTVEKLGPFKLCDIVQPNIREFRKWYRRRRKEVDEQARQYRAQQAEIDARYKLIREAERAALPVQASPSGDDFDPFFDDSE